MLKHSFFLWITDVDKKSKNIFSVFHSLWCAFATMLPTNTFPASGGLCLTSLRGQRCNIERETNRLLADSVSLFQVAYRWAGIREDHKAYKFSELLDCFWCITHASKAKILIIKTACSDDSDSSILLCKCVRSQEVCSPSPVHNAVCVQLCLAWAHFLRECSASVVPHTWPAFPYTCRVKHACTIIGGVWPWLLHKQKYC